MRELEFIGGGIADVVRGITQPFEGADALDPLWDPFETEAFRGMLSPSGDPYSLESFGINVDAMQFTGLPGDISTDFYTPYQAGEDLQLYDPEKKLPWEAETAYIPGGQR